MMWIIAILGIAAIVLAGLYVRERNNHQILQARFDGLAMSLDQAGREIERITGHNNSLKETVTSCRKELISKNQGIEALTAKDEVSSARLAGLEQAIASYLKDIEAQEEEIQRLTAEFEKLTAEYNQLGLKMPAFRPKAVRWSGPDGARAQIERALAEQKSQSVGATAAQQTKVRKKSKD